MDLVDNWPLERLDDYTGPAYNAGLAHGIVSGSIIILLIWLCCIQSTMNRRLYIRDRLRDAAQLI